MLKFRLISMFLVVLMIILSFIVIGSVDARPDHYVIKNESDIKYFKFSTKNVYYGKKATIKVKLIGHDNKPVKNMKLFVDVITPGSPYPGKFLNTIKTDSKGIATIKYKLTEFGYNTILVQSDEIIPSYGGGDNTAMCDLYVYKSFLKQSNNVFVKNRTIGMKSYFKVFGPKHSTFKIYYRIPKGVKYIKPKIKCKDFKSAKVTYNRKKRIAVLKVTKLKPKRSISLRWRLSAKSGNYILKSIVKKPKSTKFKGNNVLKKIKV